MPPAKITYDLPPAPAPSVLREDGIESGFIGKLQGLKYEYRPDITNRATQAVFENLSIGKVEGLM